MRRHDVFQLHVVSVKFFYDRAFEFDWIEILPLEMFSLSYEISRRSDLGVQVQVGIARSHSPLVVEAGRRQMHDHEHADLHDIEQEDRTFKDLGASDRVVRSKCEERLPQFHRSLQRVDRADVRSRDVR